MVNIDAPETGQMSPVASAGDANPGLLRQTQSKMRSTKSGGLKVRLSYEHMAHDVLKESTFTETHQWSYLRTALFNAFESTIYSILMGFIICLNAFLVIHQTDVKAEVGQANMPGWIESASSTFLLIYTIEIILRFYVYRMIFFTVGWNIIDLLVVIIDVCAEVAKTVAGGSAPSVSILRIFRLVRLLKLISMLTVFTELQTMLLGFASAMKAMVWASLMIAIVLTVCSIIAVEFIHPLNVEVAKTGLYEEMGCRRCARAFETVAESNLTFIQQIIAGDSWGKITIPIMEAYPASGVFFLVVFGLIDLGVLNLILTVIVNAAESARETNHEITLRAKRAQTEEMKEKLKKLCAQLDHDDSSRLTLEEFIGGIDNNEEFRKTLALLDIQRQDAEVIYHLMDEDNSGDVDYNEFVHTMISTKHETVNTKLLFLKASISMMSKEMQNLDTKLNEHVISNLIEPSHIKEAVHSAMDERPEKVAQTALQPDRIIAEVESLTRNLEHRIEQRWEQLQAEQERLLERAIGEALVAGQKTPSCYTKSPIQPQGIARKTSSSSISMPPSSLADLHCTPCKVINTSRSRIVYDAMAPERPAEFPNFGDGTRS